MKSKNKTRKILIRSQLLQEIRDRDTKILSFSQKLDAVDRAMIDLAEWLGMENIEKCSIFDVITEVKKQIGTETEVMLKDTVECKTYGDIGL